MKSNLSDCNLFIKWSQHFWGIVPNKFLPP